METKKLQKGAALNIALLISMFVLSLALGMSVIVFSQMKMMGEVGHSVVAFYAADTGIEKALYMKWVGEDYNWDTEGGSVPIDGASYSVSYNSPIWKSVGAYGNTRRAVEITEEILTFTLSFVQPCYECFRSSFPHSCDFPDRVVVRKPGSSFSETSTTVLAVVTGGYPFGDIEFSVDNDIINPLNASFSFSYNSTCCALPGPCTSCFLPPGKAQLIIHYDGGSSEFITYHLNVCGTVGGTNSFCIDLPVTVDNSDLNVCVL